MAGGRIGIIKAMVDAEGVEKGAGERRERRGGSGEWRAESPVQFLIQTDLTPLLGLPEPCDISINFDFFCFRAFFLSLSHSLPVASRARCA